ncbi:hypothetical protein RvY_06306 [Ramazzottius varieornatus]|uniref:DDE-1 domain-containing protein n=1 Tax=Ramazzottius varieornatus TaxID=947166 RepID=A0A1D1UYN9_RAMVA|nr:hypothetical protein RvY_06306 [Ramazzottius varieornatus]
MRFEKATSVSQLNEWEKQKAARGSRIVKLKAIRPETGKPFFLAKQEPHIVKDTTNRNLGLAGFTASSWWVAKFKRYYGICDKKIIKFVTGRYLKEEAEMKKSADERTRKLLPILFLEKDNGIFGPIIKRTMFKARNLHATASTSGKMTKQLLIEWWKRVFFSYMHCHCIFLADSWPTFADQDAVEKVRPEELEYEMITIPPKVTGQIQPLDVLCFRMYKGYFRKISNWIFSNDQSVIFLSRLRLSQLIEEALLYLSTVSVSELRLEERLNPLASATYVQDDDIGSALYVGTIHAITQLQGYQKHYWDHLGH